MLLYKGLHGHYINLHAIVRMEIKNTCDDWTDWHFILSTGESWVERIDNEVFNEIFGDIPELFPD